jgi:NAD(P)-dependent dehydrogenase (short-subunit alcohol dehydrogenase family)
VEVTVGGAPVLRRRGACAWCDRERHRLAAMDRPLQDCIAVVTGASRGAGRGVAVELGAAGATVVVTGRSTRAQAAQSYGGLLALAGLPQVPGSIDDTADEVTRAGGRGIAIRCDHARDDDVAALFERVRREFGRVDVLVNNAWGGHETFDGVFDAPFWRHPLAHWDSMMDRGVRNHLVAGRHAAPLMVERRRGLIVTTTFHDRGRYLRGNLFYDLAKAAMSRLAFAMAEELRPHGVASLAVSPGWMRTEFVLLGHQANETNWHERPSLARTESPRYLGRAVAALAADPQVMRKSGGVHLVADLAAEYGFTDIDGRRVPAFEMD